MKHKNMYAAIGYVVTRFGLPAAKRQARKSAKRGAKGAATGATNAARSHPARTSIAVGVVIGAIGWLATRGRDDASGDIGGRDA
jgi:hypothetical protein